MLEIRFERRSVTQGKYGEEEVGWSSCKVSERYGVWVQKNIIKGWNTISRRVTFEVGNGRRVKLWKDK